MAMPSVPNTNAGNGTNPGEARTIPTIAVNTINKLTLGLVSSRKSRHPGLESTVISGSVGAIAMVAGRLRLLRWIRWIVLHGTGLPVDARLPLHRHELIHGHHVVVEMGHDQDRAEDNQARNKQSECQCKEVIRLIGRGRYVEKERQMHPHLCDRERGEQYRHGRRIYE